VQSDAFTIVVTSCGRFDLLEATLRSLFAHLDRAPAKAIVVEDSCDQRVRDVVAALADGAAFPMEAIVNEEKLGQIASIDMAYEKVETPFIFHCEDDWEFFRNGFIAESFAILKAHPDVSTVGLRARDQINTLERDLPARKLDGVEYFLSDPALHPEYFSYSFNPGLRRLADAQKVGPFAPIGHEADISYAFKKAGFRTANLERPCVGHIGDGRHVDDPAAPRRPKNTWQRLQRSVEKRIKRVRRAISERGDG